MTVEFFTVNQMAEITQVSRATIYHMISSGEIIPKKLLSSTRIHKSQFAPQAQAGSGGWFEG